MLSQTHFQCDVNHKAFSYIMYSLPSPKIKFIRRSCPFQSAYYYHQRTVEQLSNPTHGMFPNSLLQFHELICCLLLTTPHTSSPCNLYLHTTHPVFKEFLEKGGDFNQQREPNSTAGPHTLLQVSSHWLREVTATCLQIKFRPLIKEVDSHHRP